MAAPKLVDLDQAATMTGLTRKALARRVERGSLRAAVRNGRRMVAVSDLVYAGLVPAEAPDGGDAVSASVQGSGGGEGKSPAPGSEQPRRVPGDVLAMLAAERAEDREIIVRQAEELGRLKAIAERSESSERQLATEREALARMQAAYVEEQARASAAEERVRDLEARLTAAAPVVSERRGLLGRIFGG